MSNQKLNVVAQGVPKEKNGSTQEVLKYIKG